MHRIDVPSATPEHLFTGGSPTGGVPATTVSADWLNDLQENVVAVIEAAGIPLVKGNYGQLLAALTAKNLSSLGDGGATSMDYVRIPFRHKTTGLLRYLIVQWGTYTTNASGTVHNFPIAFSSLVAGIQATDANVSSVEGIAVQQLSLTQFSAIAGGSTPGFSILAIGF